MYRYALALVAVFAMSDIALAEGSVDRGMGTFAQNCSACHSIEPDVNKLGPTLAGIAGRTAGSVQGFQYSAELAAQDFIWNDATLVEYLTTPTQSGGGDQMLHSVHMHFEGLSTQNAEDLVAFLKGFK